MLEVLARVMRYLREIKGIQIGKEVKASLFTDDIVYVSNPKHSTKRLLQLTNAFSKVSRYKINSKRSVALLHTNDKLAENEIRENCFSR